jgi:hypothetical protein
MTTVRGDEDDTMGSRRSEGITTEREVLIMNPTTARGDNNDGRMMAMANDNLMTNFDGARRRRRSERMTTNNEPDDHRRGGLWQEGRRWRIII